MNTKFLLKFCYKVFAIILFSSIILSMMPNTYSNAFDKFAFNTIEEGNSDAMTTVEDTTKKAAATAMNVVKIACVSIAVIVLLVIAMKYMIAAPGERADIKKHAVPYVIGVVILFAASGIIEMIGKLTQVFE